VVVIFGGFLGIFFSFVAIFWAKNQGICKRKFFKNIYICVCVCVL
jgi:hypothetical protein